jgi:deoxyribodipyrimidine photo-lyase
MGREMERKFLLANDEWRAEVTRSLPMRQGYLATTDNIARFTEGRFRPVGLAREATALTEPPPEPPRRLPPAPAFAPAQPSLLLVTPEDMNPEPLINDRRLVRSVTIARDANLLWGDRSRNFVRAAAWDTAARLRDGVDGPVEVSGVLEAEPLASAARAANVRQIITACAPVGPTADALARITRDLARDGVALVSVRRDWDARFWPHARAGFFSFRKQIPTLLAESGLS